MKKIFALTFFILTSCMNKRDNYIYEVRGHLNGDLCIWYLNEYYKIGDTIVYKNSDSTETKIAPPVIIKKLKQIKK